MILYSIKNEKVFKLIKMADEIELPCWAGISCRWMESPHLCQQVVSERRWRDVGVRKAVDVKVRPKIPHRCHHLEIVLIKIGKMAEQIVDQIGPILTGIETALCCYILANRLAH